MHDLTTFVGVEAHMREATSEKDWNRRAKQVRCPHGGYPHFWHTLVTESNMKDEVLNKVATPVQT